ncbi:hypothetical protein D3C81_1599710 [compost metagenome]
MDISQFVNLGIGGASLVVLYGITKLLINKFSGTDKVVQANTKAINQLTLTLDRQTILDEQFRREMLSLSKDTNDKVKDIHDRVVQ